ncbi:MAG: hypothetical protein V5A87_00625 [Candidatus Bipolaricaulota bacterium]|nr:hypothetical protein [Candidatus Bipolaricaulota bacterium]MBS3791063.1 hypothetical protein [Candidatus Bipolaricaulota bacterium]
MFRKILSEAERARFHAFGESMGSEAEIGSSEFHAGEFTYGFIEQLPENNVRYFLYKEYKAGRSSILGRFG